MRVKFLADAVVLVTGDTDLVPAIEIARATFPDKSIGVLFPYKRHNHELKLLADVSMKCRPGLYTACQLPDEVLSPDGQKIRKPASW